MYTKHSKTPIYYYIRLHVSTTYHYRYIPIYIVQVSVYMLLLAYMRTYLFNTNQIYQPLYFEPYHPTAIYVYQCLPRSLLCLHFRVGVFYMRHTYTNTKNNCFDKHFLYYRVYYYRYYYRSRFPGFPYLCLYNIYYIGEW